jgi:NTE family protein
LAIVLSGGGARGAYQAGILKYIGEKFPHAHFDILVGSSSGAINVAGLASFRGKLSLAGIEVAKLWESLRITQVFRVDAFSLLKMAFRWTADLIFGGIYGRPIGNSLVDTKPLRTLLDSIMKPDQIHQALVNSELKSIAMTATEVFTGSAVTFVQSRSYQPWKRARRRSENAILSADHVMASAAIPLLFPSQLVGPRQYVDGCIRSTAPLGPAARLGARKILAIGVRKHVPVPEEPPTRTERRPSAAKLASLILNSLFSESLDADAEHLERLNKVVQRLGDHHAEVGMKMIDILVLRPSEDLGEIASQYHRELPVLVRYLLRGLGSEQGGSGDILSYLMFVPGYTRRLIDLGYSDARAEHSRLEEFFS